MIRIPLFLFAALLGVAAAAPAQISIEGRLGRQLRGVVAIGGGGFHQPRAHCEPVRRHLAPRGHWQTVHDQVLVPGYWRDEHVPPTYGWVVDRCGRRHWGIVDHGGCRRVWVPARWETRSRQVWVNC
jgi:hypothetical protein